MKDNDNMYVNYSPLAAGVVDVVLALVVVVVVIGAVVGGHVPLVYWTQVESAPACAEHRLESVVPGEE